MKSYELLDYEIEKTNQTCSCLKSASGCDYLNPFRSKVASIRPVWLFCSSPAAPLGNHLWRHTLVLTGLKLNRRVFLFYELLIRYLLRSSVLKGMQFIWCPSCWQLIFMHVATRHISLQQERNEHSLVFRLNFFLKEWVIFFVLYKFFPIVFSLMSLVNIHKALFSVKQKVESSLVSKTSQWQLLKLHGIDQVYRIANVVFCAEFKQQRAYQFSS